MLLTAAPAAAQEPAPPVPPDPAPFLTLRDSGLLALGLAATFLADGAVRDLVQDNRGEDPAVVRVGNAFGNGRYVVPVLGAGYLVGRALGARGVSRAALRAGEAFALAGGVSVLLKEASGRPRPVEESDPDDFDPFSGGDSFPSGHATVAFAVATALAEQTASRAADIGLYAAAGLTAFSRLHDDKHWASDVFAGALIGHLAGTWVSRGDHVPAVAVGPGGAALRLRF